MTETPAWRTTSLCTTTARDFETAYGGRWPRCVSSMTIRHSMRRATILRRASCRRTIDLVNLRRAGHSPDGRVPDDLSMATAVQDLEAPMGITGVPPVVFCENNPSTGGTHGLGHIAEGIG